MFQGPAEGSVPSGIVLSVGSFSRLEPIYEPREKIIKHKEPIENQSFYIDPGYPLPPYGSNYVEEQSLNSSLTDYPKFRMLNSFLGFGQQNGIPPDPHMAVGTNHIMVIVNSSFRIFDKQGNLLAEKNADAWYGALISGVFSFDPKVLFDHFHNRWIMVWLDQNDSPARGNLILSVSDDDNPMGLWYNWALPSNLNGSTNVGNWTDYQGVGFDDQAIYITGSQFSFAGSYQYAKLRIVPKAQLYANTAGSCSWFDFWDFRYTFSQASRVFTLRPSIQYGTNSTYQILCIPEGSSTAISLYKVANPTTSPTISGNTIFVNQYFSAPNAGQLGGGTPIEAGSARQRCEPVFRDGYLYAVHSVANPVNASYSNLRYLKINTNTNLVEEDVSYGAPGLWHFYPAITVDSAHNIAITFCRSGDNEWVGAWFVTKAISDAPGFTVSNNLRPGFGNYVRVASGRNRWGDYSGIWLDPVNQKDFWMHTEYAAAVNTYSSWVGQITVMLENGPNLIGTTPVVKFNPTEINTLGDTLSVVLKNFGTQRVTINSISDNGPFKVLPGLNFPVNLDSYDEFELQVTFQPTSVGNFELPLLINSNSNNPTPVTLMGRGFEINPALSNTLYSSSANGKTYTIDFADGSATELGESNYPIVTSLAVNPKNNLIYGLVNSGNTANIMRMNSLEGDAYPLFSLNFNTSPTGLAFDTSGTLHLALRNGKIVKVDLENQTAVAFDSIKTAIYSFAFHPVTNQVWASIYKPTGSNRDLLIKMLPGGDTVRVGYGGLNLPIIDLEFTSNGDLFALMGTTTTATSFTKLNTENGAATIIGNTDITYLTGIAIVGNDPADVDDKEITSLPSNFSLEQNYPNPFNPSTTIGYSITEESKVSLKVYNLLGELVGVLVNQYQQPGYYNVKWNSVDLKGKSLPSGVYFYELTATNRSNESKRLINKMILTK